MDIDKINNVKSLTNAKVATPIKLIYFEGDRWSRELDGSWTNISKIAKTKADQDLYVKGMIRAYLQSKNDYKEAQGFELSKEDEINSKKVGGYFNRIMISSIYENNVQLKDIDRDKIEFLDCIVDINKGTTIFRKNRKTEFTPYQVRLSIANTYNTFVANPDRMNDEQRKKKELVDKFFNEVSGNDNTMKTSLLEVIGSTMAPINDSIFPIFYSPHRSSGKGTMFEIIGNINGLSREIHSEKWWGKNKSQFALSNVRNQLMAFIDEVPQRLPEASTEMIKRYADSKEHVEIERKSIDQEQTLNTMTFMAATNKRVNFYSIDDSLKGRVIWYEFMMNANKSKENVFTKTQLKFLTKDKECLEYIAVLAIQAYSIVTKRPGERNAIFTKPLSNKMFWEAAEEDNIALDIISNNIELAAIWDAKDKFIGNSLIKDSIMKFKMNNIDSIPKLYNLQTFKVELIDYIHSKNLGVAESNSYNNERGIRIKWFDKGEK